MVLDNVIEGNNIEKKYGKFMLNISSLNIPKGVSTALIGENGAGKSTLLNILAGLCLDYKGDIKYFDEKGSIEDERIKDKIGYTGPNNFFLPQWTIKQIKEMGVLLYDSFDVDKFDKICDEVRLDAKVNKKYKELSDGNRMKLILATALARENNLLILDEPASPLDPLMRDKLCEIILDYLNKGDGENTVFFSTHNISDMEKITDYAIIMSEGSIVEEGFVEDLKEKYVIVKGDNVEYQSIPDCLIGKTINHYGFEGLVKVDDLDKLAGYNVEIETPTLSQITVSIMKKYSKMAKSNM